jgi:hypothetical protein
MKDFKYTFLFFQGFHSVNPRIFAFDILKANFVLLVQLGLFILVVALKSSSMTNFRYSFRGFLVMKYRILIIFIA